MLRIISNFASHGVRSKSRRAWTGQGDRQSAKAARAIATHLQELQISRLKKWANDDDDDDNHVGDSSGNDDDYDDADRDDDASEDGDAGKWRTMLLTTTTIIHGISCPYIRMWGS